MDFYALNEKILELTAQHNNIKLCLGCFVLLFVASLFAVLFCIVARRIVFNINKKNNAIAIIIFGLLAICSFVAVSLCNIKGANIAAEIELLMKLFEGNIPNLPLSSFF